MDAELRDAMSRTGVKPTELERDLAVVMGHGLRLRALVALLAEQVLRAGEKAVVWTSYPIMQKLLVSILTAFGMRARAFLSSLDAGQRTTLVNSFNDTASDDLQVLVCNYSCSPAGYNMQKANRNVHLFDPAPCESAKLQAVGRTHRIGQRRLVRVVQYSTPQTYNSAMLGNSALQMAVANIAMMQPETLVDLYADEETPEADRTRMAGLRGFWILGNDLVHDSAPNFHALKDAAEANHDDILQAGAEDIALFASRASYGSLAEIRGGVGQSFLDSPNKQDTDGQLAGLDQAAAAGFAAAVGAGVQSEDELTAARRAKFRKRMAEMLETSVEEATRSAVETESAETTGPQARAGGTDGEAGSSETASGARAARGGRAPRGARGSGKPGRRGSSGGSAGTEAASPRQTRSKKRAAAEAAPEDGRDSKRSRA